METVFDWNDTNVNRLKTKWASGDSSGKIADDMHTTRSTIMGKVARLGLPKRRPIGAKDKSDDLPKSTKIRQAKPKTPLRKLMEEANVSPSTALTVVSNNTCSFSDLKDDGCRWAMNDSLDSKEFIFCGCKRATGLPYCNAHAMSAYNASTHPKARKSPYFLTQKLQFA